MRGIALLLLLPVFSLAAPLLAAGAENSVARPAANSPASGPEPMLSEIFSAIGENRLDSALKKTETLLKHYPNFRLAHLIKGDLLLARSMPLSTFGNARNAPREKLDDLREEIIARLRAYRDRPNLDNYVPRYLLQMRSDQKYAIVVDTQKARLYLYKNQKDGSPRFVADYYISYGKLGAGKMLEGDKKTPTGVYHITSSLPAQKIGDLYGAGAFPINYPNEWDKRNGRKGHGIWLHGTPSDTYSRPPKASDGCVVLANVDLNALAKNVQIGLTPVIISNSIEWLSFDDWENERSALKKKIDEWRHDWESRDIGRYMRHYSKRFQTSDQTREQFAEQKRRVNTAKEWIKIRLSNLSMFRNPGNEELVLVAFEQDYRSNNLDNLMLKRQYWVREDGAWKIIFEGAYK
ncbi:MAG: L,D-transpeptidase family protein [Candidatus Accumulibacter sp.]|jgi:murein L,D-transpeptidase YafK|nr:L,D-transpeptidase family protein [Accumulibacter sp.]